MKQMLKAIRLIFKSLRVASCFISYVVFQLIESVKWTSIINSFILPHRFKGFELFWKIYNKSPFHHFTKGGRRKNMLMNNSITLKCYNTPGSNQVHTPLLCQKLICFPVLALFFSESEYRLISHISAFNFRS